MRNIHRQSPLTTCQPSFSGRFRRACTLSKRSFVFIHGIVDLSIPSTRICHPPRADSETVRQRRMVHRPGDSRRGTKWCCCGLLKTLTEFRVSCRVFYVGCVAREGHLLWFIRIPSSRLCSAAIFARFGSGYWSQCFACIVRCLYR